MAIFAVCRERKLLGQRTNGDILGKMENEWLHGRHFKTRDEAKTAIFEYVEIFYNRQRIHESNDYVTPDEYYFNAMVS